MIDKQDVIDFFDKCAVSWDEEMIKSDEIVNIILDNAEITEGKSVLDVACGTGVLIGDYLKRNVKSVTGIDISSEMIKRAKDKFNDPRVSFIYGDAMEYDFDMQFGAVMIYNAFPHFPEPEKLIDRLSGLLTNGGTLTVAHGMSREKIDAHHHGAANGVSVGLMEADKLAEIMSRRLSVTVKISDERMYQVTGKKL